MLRYVTKRILVTIPVLIGVTLIIFTLMYFTKGDPARMILGDMATEEEVQELREEMGLNDPFLVRYANYLVGLCHGDLGTSYVTGLPRNHGASAGNCPHCRPELRLQRAHRHSRRHPVGCQAVFHCG